MTRDPLAASVLAGAASGARSFTGFAAVALTADPQGSAPDRILARPIVRFGIAALAAAEYIADKLPMTPSRLEAPGLAGRLVFAAASGAVLAQRRPIAELEAGDLPSTDQQTPPSAPLGKTLACVGAAVASSLATAVGGMRARAWVGRRVGHDAVPAVAEDVAALALAGAAVR